jgi:hypothetical protein
MNPFNFMVFEQTDWYLSVWRKIFVVLRNDLTLYERNRVAII